MSTLTLKELERIERYLECAGNDALSTSEQSEALSMFETLMFSNRNFFLSLARRQLEQEAVGKREAPSCSAQTKACAVPDVEPLGVPLKDEGALWERLYFEDDDRDSSCISSNPDRVVFTGNQHGLSFSREKTESLIAHLQSWLDHGTFELKPQPVQSDSGALQAVDPGEGWRLLKEGEPLQEGDGFLDPSYPKWISYECRPDIFRGSKATGCPAKDYAHTWPWRRRVQSPPQSADQ